MTACENQLEPAKDGDFIYSCVLPAVENGKTAWVPGDQILIHGEFSEDQKIVTLTEKDIENGGKTCYVSVEGIAPYVQKGVKSVYYAAYPAELVSNPSQCKDANNFSSTNALLMCSYDADKSFVFDYIIGGIAFTVSGDYDSYELKGNCEENVGYTSLSCRISPNVKVYEDKKGSKMSLITGKVVADGKTVNHIAFPEQPIFVEGFCMVFYKNGTPVKYLYTEKKYEIKRAGFIPLGDITANLIDCKEPAADSHISAIPTADATDLGAAETANCYIVSAPGVYSFKAVKGNSTTPLSSIGSVELLWESWGNTEEVAPNSVIAAVDFQKDQIYFQVNENYHAGNAVIAAKDDMGVIMWSWHIWIPKTEITTDLYNLSRKKSMDRNLGALVAVTEDGANPEAVGLVYQWGRKDPFVGVGTFAEKKAATVAGKEREIVSGQFNTVQATKNPTGFASFEGNWNSSVTEELWEVSKTMYDPCPPGYRVPYRSDYLPFSNTIEELQGWAYAPDKYMFSVGRPLTFYPLGGYLSWSGEYSNVGTGERVWSSRTHETSTMAYNFRISPDGDSVSYGNSGKEKANGYAVRCVVYESTPFENAPGTPVAGDYTRYKVDMQELSGVRLHTDGSFLWGVGDQGLLAKISFDGKLEKVLSRALDMEAITLNPATGDIYIGCEPDVVFKISAPDYNKPVEAFKIPEAKGYGNSGVEGISWYKEDMLLVGTQTGAYLWAYKYEGLDENGKEIWNPVWKKSMRTVAIGQLEIADIHYDPVKDQIWIIDSETQCVYLFNGDATEHLATYKVNFGGNCESVCLDYGNSCVWIADDTDPSRLFKINLTF